MRRGVMEAQPVDDVHAPRGKSPCPGHVAVTAQAAGGGLETARWESRKRASERGLCWARERNK